MFGLGFSEIMVLAVLGLILLGPEQLPEVAKTIGRFISDLKRSTEELTDEFKKNNLGTENLLEDIRSGIKIDEEPLPSNEIKIPDEGLGHTPGGTEPVQLEMDTTTSDNSNEEQDGNGKKSKPH